MLGAEREVVGRAAATAPSNTSSATGISSARKSADRTADLLDAAAVGRGEVSERRQGERAAHAADTPLTRAAAALWLCERMSASSTICMTRSS